MMAERDYALQSPVGRRNNVRIVGTGAPILFAHGYGCDQTVWRHVVQGFPDCQAVLFDHVGAGGSDISAFNRFRYRSLQGYVTDVIELVEELQLRDVTVVGHSVSSVIGLLAGIARPDLFRSIIMLAPSPCYLNQDGYTGGFTTDDIQGLLDLIDANHMGWSAAMAPTIMGNPERPELAQELEAKFCSMDPEIARHFARVTFLSNHLEDLPKLQVPSLILQCSDDRIAPASVGKYMAEHIPNSELVTMRATGHCPHLSAPEETIAEIRRFLGKMSTTDNAQ